jgi:hypothetical protein
VVVVWAVVACALAVAGVAFWGNFKGIAMYFYRRQARSWSKVGMSESEYAEGVSYRTFRYAAGAMLWVGAVAASVAAAIGMS